MRMQIVSRYAQHGYTLIEVLLALTLSSVLLAVMVASFINQRKTYAIQEEVAAMMQNGMAGLDLMKREIMMIGYDPTATAGAGIVAATANSLQFTMDLNGDGDLGDTEENVTYALYDPDADGDQDLGRTVDGATQLVAENIDSMSLTYTLADGTTTTTPTAAELSQIRLVEVSLTSRTARPDPQYPTHGGYRTQLLTMAIHLRNLED